MQEEVNQKTVALSIRTTKLTGKVLAAALGKVARALQKHHRKALTPQGRQSVKKLMNHYGGKSAMPYVGAPKDFDRIAKEFHVDYAFYKVSPGHYLLFFKANQADAIIDDLGVERSTEYAMEQMFFVIDSRYRSRRPMIITTNLKLAELKNPPDLAHARIYDRILERCAPILFDGKNFREENAGATRQTAKDIVNSKQD